jgi:anti-sigma regulatory factor (Ser/Thr protein kinase)
MTTTPRAVTGLALAAVPTAVRCSRMFVQSCLREWGLPALAEDSELVVSELVTNAVRATGVTDTAPRWSQLAKLATIEVRLALFERSLLIAIWDNETTPPVLRDHEADSENGRGLSIVAALSEQWDYFLPATGGKYVWAELAIPHNGLLPATANGAADASARRHDADGRRALPNQTCARGEPGAGPAGLANARADPRATASDRCRA